MSIITPSHADVTLIFPDESERTVNMLRLLVHTQNAEMKAKYGMFLPNVGKLHPTVKALRDEYGIPATTWEQAATQLRRLHTDVSAAIAEARR
jgi:hypothetical protein